MVTITIFVAAIMAIIFFLIGIIFKGLASAFNALLLSIKKTTLAFGYGILIIVGLVFIHSIVEDIKVGKIFEIIDLIFAIIICSWLIKLLFGFLLSITWGLIFYLITSMILKISEVLENLSYYSEKSYSYFLSIIVNRLEKC